MLSRAKPKRAVAPDEMDPASTNWLFNVANGVIDLHTGDLLPHDRKRRITRLSNIVYDPTATSPMWEGVLNRSLAGNQALIDYFARAVGYSMIGAILDRVIFILWGLGRNGKTVIRETVSALFSDYGAGTPISTFLERKGGGIPNDLARLKGVRFVSASESEEGARLAPAFIKQVTGGDSMTARFLHAEFFDFVPTFHVWLATNHRPEIPGGGDQALWDRIHLVPFKIQIPPDEMIPLAELLGMLRAEMPGILAWAVRGCLAYQREGLNPPDEVRAAVGDYQNDQDVLADFLDGECLTGPGLMVRSSDIYKRYVEWCGKQGISRPMTTRGLGRRLASHGFDHGLDRVNGRFWIGIGLVDRGGP
jgi:putative DNA primase/helicase